MLGNSLLLISALAIGLVSTEFAYRAYLSSQTPSEPPSGITVYSRSVWAYDEALGYTYRPGTSSDWAMLVDGEVRRCGTLEINMAGSAGQMPAEGEPEIAVFGDSFTMATHDGKTWLDLLNAEIARRTGAPAEIRNYSRDGYGVLQMFDQAAAALDAGLQPDIVVVAIIGPDLIRRRGWRMEVEGANGTELHYASVPSQEVRPETHMRAAMFHAEATREWCEAQKRELNRDDRIVREVVAEHRRLWEEDRRFTGEALDLWSLSVCYVCNTLATGTPFADRRAPELRTGLQTDTYRTDARFVRAAARLQDYPAPIWLVYLPYEPEWRSGELALSAQETSLLSELREIADRTFVLLPPEPLGEAAIPLTMLPEDGHPSMQGLQYYADMLTPLIVEDVEALRDTQSSSNLSR